MVFLGRNETSSVRLWGYDLKPPLLAEQKGQCPKIGVFVMAHGFTLNCLLGIAEQCKSGAGGTSIAVAAFKPGIAIQMQGSRQASQDDHAHIMASMLEGIKESKFGIRLQWILF
jgi:hypothetical protein